jgi:V-ATPase subunit H
VGPTICTVLIRRPWRRLLDSQDDFIRLKSLAILATLVASDASVPESAVTSLLQSISRLLPKPVKSSASSTVSTQAQPDSLAPAPEASSSTSPIDTEARSVAVQALDAIFGKASIRIEAWRRERELQIVEGLANLVRGHVNVTHSPVPSPPTSGRSTPINSASNTALSPQIQYQVGFALWLLSFEREFCREASTAFGLVQLLADLARYAVKEKIVRVVLATFRVCDTSVHSFPPNFLFCFGFSTEASIEFCGTRAGRKSSHIDTEQSASFCPTTLNEPKLEGRRGPRGHGVPFGHSSAGLQKTDVRPWLSFFFYASHSEDGWGKQDF